MRLFKRTVDRSLLDGVAKALRKEYPVEEDLGDAAMRRLIDQLKRIETEERQGG